MIKNRVLIVAGGTGGHVFPALAVAQIFQQQNVEVEWLGTRRGLEASVVPKAGIYLHTVTVAGIRGVGWVSKCWALLQVCCALIQAMRILWRFKPNIVLGMGGFVAGPAGIAAWLLGYPLVIHEQNAIAGTTNRILRRFARRVLEGFPNSFPKGNPVALWSGNPIREEFTSLPPPNARFQTRTGALRMLIIGGSRGASALNELCPEAFSLIPETIPLEIWHQTGEKEEKNTKAHYFKKGLKARVNAFIHNVAEAYAWADLVICRAGALTIAELAATGIGGILIPFPFAVDDHQTHNGRILEEAGAAYMVQQTLLNPAKLADMIISLGQNRVQLLKMANAARTIAKPNAAVEVVEYCKEVWCVKGK